MCLQGVTKKGLVPILQHVYSNTALQLSKGSVMDILYAASLLQIPFIMEECLRYLKNVVDETNCVDVLNLTFTFQVRFKKKNLGHLKSIISFAETALIIKKGADWVFFSSFEKKRGQKCDRKRTRLNSS